MYKPNNYNPMDINTLDFESLAVSSAEQGIVEGYAATFGNHIGKYNIEFQKGCFQKTLKESLPKNKIKFLFNHKEDDLLGTLMDAQEDDKGLFVRLKLDIENLADAKEKWSLVKSEALNTFSIGWYTMRSKLAEAGHKILTECKLRDISLVTFEGNEQAVVTGFLNEKLSSFDEEYVTGEMCSELWEMTNALTSSIRSILKENNGDVVTKVDESLTQFHAKVLEELMELMTKEPEATPAPDMGGLSASDRIQKALFGSDPEEMALTTSMNVEQAKDILKGELPKNFPLSQLQSELPSISQDILALQHERVNELCDYLKEVRLPDALISRINSLSSNVPAVTTSKHSGIAEEINRLEIRRFINTLTKK